MPLIFQVVDTLWVAENCSRLIGCAMLVTCSRLAPKKSSIQVLTLPQLHISTLPNGVRLDQKHYSQQCTSTRVDHEFQQHAAEQKLQGCSVSLPKAGTCMSAFLQPGALPYTPASSLCTFIIS